MEGVNGSGSWNLVSVRLVLMINSQMLNPRQNEENFCKNGVCRYFPMIFEWFEMRLGRFVLRLRRSKGDWWFWPTSNSHNHPPYEN